MIYAWLISLICLFGCSSASTPHRVGIDPSFFPLDVAGKDANVYAFTNELLQEIGRLKRLNIERINTNWDSILFGLQEEKYDAIISSMRPYVYNLGKYRFSAIFLPSGPILVVPINSSVSSLADLKNEMVAVMGEQAAEYVAR